MSSCSRSHLTMPAVPNLRDLAYGVGVTMTSPIWGVSLLRTGKWRTDWAGRYGHAIPLPGDDTKTLLFNAVSVGEVSLLRVLIDELIAREPTLRIVVAATTNTGYQRAAELYADKHTVVRYPLDFSWVVARVLDRSKPDAVCTVELEVWPNFMEVCASRGVPVAVINGRLTARSFRGYRKIRALIKPAFAKLNVSNRMSETTPKSPNTCSPMSRAPAKKAGRSCGSTPTGVGW